MKNEIEKIKEGEKIIIDGCEQTIYLCDQKAPCRNSKSCGKQCIYTPDAKHELTQLKI